MTLVADYRNAWKWYSVHTQALGAVLSAGAAAAAGASGVGELGGVIPVWAVCLIFTGVFVAGLGGRLLAQGGVQQAIKPTVPPSAGT